MDVHDRSVDLILRRRWRMAWSTSVSGRQLVYALDASTGALLWKYTTGARIYSSPAVVNGMVYIGSEDADFYAFGLPNQQMSEKFSPPQRPDPARLTPDWSLQPSQVVTSKSVKSR